MTRPRPLMVAATCAAVLAGGGLADARVGIVYDQADSARILVEPGPDGTPVSGASGWWQQQPVVNPLLPVARRAQKVSGAAGSPSTPTILGLTAEGIEALLVQRIRRAGAHVVFLDELTVAFRGEGGRPLAEALARLDRPSPWGGTYAHRVHIYVPTSPDLLARPENWGPAWEALARAGGVWFQTYRGSFAHWSRAEWEVWPGVFRRRLVAAGGDERRLHPVFTRGDQAAAWDAALTGAACALTNNGVGAFRLAPDTAAFRAQLVAAFGGDGLGTAGCRDAPVDLERAPALDTVASWTAVGTSLPDGYVTPRVIAVGVPTAVQVDLPADPLGLAGRFGLDPQAFRAAAEPRVWAVSPGNEVSAGVNERGDATLVVTPTAPGPIRLELRFRASAIAVPGATAGWVDRLAAAGAPREQQDFAARLPGSFRLRVPLGSAADPLVSPLSATGELPPVAMVRVGVAGPGRAVGRRRLLVGSVTRVDGSPVAYARLTVRVGRGRPFRVRADVRGRFRFTSAAGRVRLRVAGTAVSRTVTVPRPPARRTG